MFEDILGKDNPLDRMAKRLWKTNKNTIIVCPECGVEMMSVTLDDNEEFELVDCEFKCRQCSDDPQEILKWLHDKPKQLKPGWSIVEHPDRIN